jgi:hypothetical protein
MVEKILLEKGIKASKDELVLLEQQWYAIQQLKKGFTAVKLGDTDIGVTFKPGGVYNE